MSEVEAIQTTDTPLCKNCNKKPVFVDNGRKLDFCGRWCATDFQKKRQPQQSRRPSARARATASMDPAAPATSSADAPAGSVAANASSHDGSDSDSTVGPSQRPRSHHSYPTPDPGAASASTERCALPGCTRSSFPGRQYCGKTHYRQAADAGLLAPTTPSVAEQDPALGLSSTEGASAQMPPAQAGIQAVAQNCALPNCHRPAFPGGRYCGKTHLKEALSSGQAEACLLCGKKPKNLDTASGKLQDFCSRRCGQDTIRSAPIILPIPSTHAIHQDVVNQFDAQWKHSQPTPTVHRVWKIYTTKIVTDAFWAHVKKVEQRSSIQGGNCKRRWHGTSRLCNLGDDDSDTNRVFCEASRCSLCNIIKTSFTLNTFGKATAFGRFGSGIYTSATSSKAHAYVRENKSRYRAMILSDVVMGRTKKLTVSDPTLTGPPAGYDSVVGEPGGDLNYDEAVVYQNDAIRPLFLIIYSQ